MSERSVRAGELSLAEVGRRVRLRTLNVNVTGTLKHVWFRDAIGERHPKRVDVQVEIESVASKRAGEVKVELSGMDTIDVIDEEMDA